MASSKKNRAKAPAAQKSTARAAAAGAKKKSTTKKTRRRARKGAAPARVADGVPALALEGHTPWVADHAAASQEPEGSRRFGFIGCGRCGGRLVEALWRRGYGRVLVLHTRPQAYEACPLGQGHKLLLEAGTQGAGKDMALGRRAFEQGREAVLEATQRLFGGVVDHVMIALGGGGGTGGGAVLPLLEMLRAEAKALGLADPGTTIGVLCTLPTAARASVPHVADNARSVTGELTAQAAAGRLSPLVFIDNDRISRMYPDLIVSDFLPTINETTSGLFDIFNRLSAVVSGRTSFGAAAYEALLRAGGCAVMGLATLDPNLDERDLVEEVCAQVPGTLLADGFRLQSASAVGVLAVGGGGALAGDPGLRHRLAKALDALKGLMPEATFRRAVLEDDRPGLRIYTFISGLEAPAERLARLVPAA